MDRVEVPLLADGIPGHLAVPRHMVSKITNQKFDQCCGSNAVPGRADILDETMIRYAPDIIGDNAIT